MPRGGRRAGAPGKAYPSRSDLNAQPIRTAPGQTYGAATAQADAQRAVPLAGGARPPAPMAMPPAAAAPAVEAGGLYQDSARPGEPVQSGLPIGPGAGPEFGGLSDEDIIAAAARLYPTSGIYRMLGGGV